MSNIALEELNRTTPPLTHIPPESWDLVMRPKTGWFDLHLADLWRYRDLVMIFVWRDFTAQYKQTILGPLWHIVQPLFTTLLFTLVFSGAAHLPTDGVAPVLFYMAGITCWNYFAQCLNGTSGTFISNAAIFGKVYFPRLCVPLSIVLSNLIKFGIQFGIFLVVLIYYAFIRGGVHITPLVLLTPVLLVIMGALGLGIGVIVSALTTRYRDLQIFFVFAVQLFMYATPVIYPASMIPEKYRLLILANPMTPVLETFRAAYLGTGTFSFWQLAYGAVAAALTLFTGMVLFNHVERTFMDTV